MSVDSEKPEEMTASQQFALIGKAINDTFGVWAANVRAKMEEAGIDLTPPPYVGNRCGWYPEKPKRRRRRP